MSGSMSKHLSPLTIAGKETERQAATLRPILWTTFAVVVISNVVAFFVGSQNPTQLFDLVWASIPVAVALVLLHWGQVRWATGIFITLMWILVTLLVWRQGGLYSPILSSYLLVILVAGVLLGERASYGFVLLSAAAAAVFLFEHDRIQLPRYSLGNYWVAIASNLVILAVILRLALKTLTTALHSVEQSQAQLAYQAMLLEDISEAIVATDPQFNVTSWNKAAEKLYGWTKEEVMGKPLNQLLQTQFVARDRETAIQQLTETGRWQREVIQYHREGHPLQIEGSVSLLRTENGQTYGAVAINRDIHQQKEAERRYQNLFETMPIMAVINRVEEDQQFIIEDCNPLFEHEIGYRKAELLGKSLLDFYVEESKPALLNSWQRSLVGHLAAEEHSLTTKNGQIIETLVQAVPIYDNKGKIIGAQTLYVDISLRKAAERQVQEYAQSLEEKVAQRTEALAQSEVRLRERTEILTAILDSMTEGVLVGDMNANITLANAAADQLIGPHIYNSSPEEWTNDFGVLRPDTLTPFARFDMPMRRAIRGEPQQGAEIVIRDYAHPEGILLSVNAVPLHSQGAIIGGVSVFRDITEAKKAQKALEQQADMLSEQNAELTAFAHTVAHDLKNPLGQVIGYSDLLEAEDVSFSVEQKKELLRFIQRAGRKMNTIIEELLLLASIRQEEVQVEPLSMFDIINEAVFRLSASIAERGAVLEVSEKWPFALGYLPWVEEVWVNYLSNALKYGGSPPHITLGATEREDGMIAFWVSDNGAGLSEEQKKQLFKPFTRLDRDRATGHGLGLSIVHRIVTKLGGQVYVESELGHGSTFGFTLPAVKEV